MLNYQSANQTIYQQMQAVQQLQSKTDIYLSLYEKFVIASSEQNQFLDNQNKNQPAPQQNNTNLQADERKNTQHQQGSIKWVEDIEYEPRKINLSRIFNQICLGDQVISNNGKSNIDIQLYYQQDSILMSLGKKDNCYNLSNFSSFNNNRINDNEQFDVKDLLCLIQQKVGRQLNRRGIENIINQIQIIVLSETQRQLKQSEITQYSLFNSKINHQSLQNHQHINQVDQAKTLRENRLFLNVKHYEQQQDKIKQAKDAKIQHNYQPTKSKQNCPLLYKRKSANVSKEIRIIKKNCFKNTLVMAYTDMKQLQNFCISNKIYGKDKDRIIKAIKQNKNIVSLD